MKQAVKAWHPSAAETRGSCHHVLQKRPEQEVLQRIRPRFGVRGFDPTLRKAAHYQNVIHLRILPFVHCRIA
jgi:hypothetical protein